MIVKLNILGMSCVNCANSIKKAVLKIDGVRDANINYANNFGIFKISDEKIKQKIIEKIENLGFEITENLEILEQKKEQNLEKLKDNFLISITLSVLIMALEMTSFQTIFKPLLMLIISTFVIFVCGKIFFIKAFASLKNHNYDMNVLVSLGAFSSYVYSVLAILNFTPKDLNYQYFGGACMIISFILLGKFLEEKSRTNSNDYIKNLINLQPQKAIKAGCKECEVDVKELKMGDIIIVKPGMQIPIDGQIVNGSADIDEKTLTGENFPVFKKTGDEVFAGSFSINGYINVKVTKNYKHSLIAQIVEIMEQASTHKMKIARLADKISNIFVPSVVIIAILTLLIWWGCGFFLKGFFYAICVLIISCPCALGLATPIAIVCAITNIAKQGIILKNPEILETITSTKNIIFDKTGTLTNGEICVQKTSLNKQDLELIASLQNKSSHPIAKAIVSFANDIKEFKGEFKNYIGKGIYGKNEKFEIFAGNLKFLEENGIKVKENFQQIDNETIIFVAINKIYKGYIALKDRPRKESKEVIEKLQNLGIKTFMLTGDNEKSTKFIADFLNIKNYKHSLLPQEKFEFVKTIDKAIFVGDGINDLPSLKVANIGLAMGFGADLAKDAGDGVLLNSNLNGILELFKISEKTMKIIKQNLFWAFLYNIICIPIATGAFSHFSIVLTPMYGAIAMSFSSVFVVLNSMRLKFVK